MIKTQASPVDRSLRRYQAFGLSIIFFMLAGAGGWAAVSEISGAVIAPALVVVDGSPKKVQHLEGGIVAGIDIANGDVVSAGAELIRLDGTELKAQLEIVKSQLNELLALRARLQSEAAGSRAMPIPQDLDQDRRIIFEAQATLLASRWDARQAKTSQLDERLGQFAQAVTGLKAQQTSKDRQIALITQELTGLQTLKDQQLVTTNRLLSLERELARLEGERGQHIADIARTEVQASETKLQLAEVRQASVSDALKELREVESKLAETLERSVAVASRLKRLSIVAPRGGVVHKLAVHTVGGVVAAGETILEIVPQEEKLALEGQLDPTTVDQVESGQAVRVRLSAFDQRTTPELSGHVAFVAPDIRQDNPNLPRYFAVRVVLSEGEEARIKGGKLVPGMPAELMIKRQDRTVLNFFVKPLLDQFAHAFREE